MTLTLDPARKIDGELGRDDRTSWLPYGPLGPVAIGIAGWGVAEAAKSTVHAADVVRLLLVVAWAVAATVVTVHAPSRRIGALVLAGTVLGAIAFAGARAGDVEAGRGGEAGRFVATLACPLLMAVSAHVLLVLPTGQLGSRSRRVTTVLVYAAALAVGSILWAVDGHVSVAVGAVLWSVAVLTMLPAAHRRYLTTSGVDRQRLQWLGCGAAVAGELALLAAALHLFIGWPQAAGAATAAATAAIPLALLATTRARLLAHVDRVLVHIVSVAGLTVVVVSVYLVTVIGLGRTPDHADQTVLGLSMLAAGATALCYVPVRGRLAEMVNRLVYGEVHPPEDVLRTFGSRLTRAIPMDELLLQLAESLRKTMNLARAEVYTGTGEFYERAASVPDRGPAMLTVGARERLVLARAGVSGSAWVAVWLPALLADRAGAQVRVAPISHSGELLGLIVIERPPDGDAFTEEDDRVLTELSRQAGLALHNVQLDSALQASLDELRRQASELRASRSRIVATADAERRKIERNLHDGAQQHLVALAVNLRLVRDMITDDPSSAGEMVDALADEVKATIQELRDLAHGIYPPLLMDAGLAQALQAAASRSPLAVEVESNGVGRYPAEVEAAVYFCCLEALQNAAKHAPGAHVTIGLREEGGGLLFEVTDDGPGYDPATATRGHGFVNMSDRLGAIGGSVRWESGPGAGSAVRASVPL